MDSINHQMKIFVVGIVTGVYVMNILLGYTGKDCVYDIHSNSERQGMFYSILKTCVNSSYINDLRRQGVFVKTMNCSSGDHKVQKVLLKDILNTSVHGRDNNWIIISVNSVVNTHILHHVLLSVTTRYPVAIVHPSCDSPHVLVVNRMALGLFKSLVMQDINYCELRNITVVKLRTVWRHGYKHKGVKSRYYSTLVYPFRKDSRHSVFLQYERERMEFLQQKLIEWSNEFNNVNIYHDGTAKSYLRIVNTQEWSFINHSFVHSTYNNNAQPKENVLNRGRRGALQSSISALPWHLNCKPEFVYQRFSACDGMSHEVKCTNGTQRYRLFRHFEGIRFREKKTIKDRPIVIILCLFRRSAIFERFLKRLQSLSYDYRSTLILRVMLFKDRAKDYTRTLQVASNPWGNIEVEVIPTKGKFSRSKGIAKGVEDLHGETLVLLMDVDMMFTVKFLRRIVQLTIRGKQAFFPVYFSRFDPGTLLRRNGSCLACKRHVFSDHFGLWRYFSFGIVGVYKSDIDQVGSFNNNMKGWGMEDVDFYNRWIESKLSVFRAVEPELWHMHHPRYCDTSLPADRLLMCHKSRLELQSSIASLADYVLRFYD